MEKTLVIVKPDGVQRNLIGEIISRFERSGLKLTALKMVRVDEDRVEKHYTIDPKWLENVGTKSIESYKKKGLTPPSEDPISLGRDVLNRLKTYISIGPVVPMILEGNQAVAMVRKICGSTEPLSAPAGTIRGDYTSESYQFADADERAMRNLVHASGSVEEAEKEIRLWFEDNEIMDYRLIQDTIINDKNWQIS